MRIIAIFLLLALSGCAFGRGRIKHAGTQVLGVKDAGKPATLETADASRGFVIPAQSKVTITRTEATPTAPAVEVTHFEVPEATKYEEHITRTDASTGTIDTEVAKKRIDTASKAPFLYAAIVCVFAAAALMVLGPWPTAALLSAVSGIVFFALWKISDLPPWFIAIAIAALSGGAFLIFGYTRAEADKKNSSRQ